MKHRLIKLQPERNCRKTQENKPFLSQGKHRAAIEVKDEIWNRFSQTFIGIISIDGFTLDSEH